MLKYIKADNSDRDTLLEMCRHSITGAEAFTYLVLNEDISGGAFWCAKNERDTTVSVIFDDGDYYIKAAGIVFSRFFAYREKCLMVYESEDVPESTAQDVSETGIFDSFKLFCECDELSFDNEKRYVARRRAVNAGLARVFAVSDNGKMISTASVSAMNEKYAVISDVFTRQEFRCRGFGANVLARAVAFSLEEGRTPLLLCDDDMRTYYENAGFRYYGKM